MALSLLLLFLPLLLIGCTSGNKTPDTSTNTEIRHAHLLQMQDLPGGSVEVRIMNPWKPEEVMTTIHITQPHKRILLSSSSHGYLLSALLNAPDCIAAFCDPQYVLDSTLRSRIEQGLIADAGSSMLPNTEIILQTGVEAVWISPMAGTDMKKFERLGIPVIPCADYMEASPLGRAEWMRLYGRLIGKGQEADLLFNKIEARYDSVCNAARNARDTNAQNRSNNVNTKKDISDANSPQSSHNTGTRSLLAELPYGSTWYVPGGCSSAALLYADAGYAYPWSGDNHAGSLALAPEAVLERGQMCDLWIFKYYSPDNDWTLEGFASQNPLYRQMKSYREGNIFGCNTAISDYFDVAPFRPDLILESLHTMDERFFKRLK